MISRVKKRTPDEQALADLRAANLRRLQGARTNVEMGVLLKMSSACVADIRRGGRGITLRIIDRLAPVFDLTPAQLLAELDRPAGGDT